MTFDPTVRLSDVLILIVTLLGVPGLRALFTMRDSVRDITHALGATEPPRGILGDIETLKDKTEQHHEWIIGAGLDRRRRPRE